MFVFKILNEKKIYTISRENFEKVTKKKFPYCQNINSKMSYFAICPECNNPINFVNLYVEDQYDDEKKDCAWQTSNF